MRVIDGFFVTIIFKIRYNACNMLKQSEMHRNHEMNKRILIAEDELRMARILREWFTKEGYQVEVCGSGNDGLAVMRRNPADIMILDVMMPGMDGLTMLRTLREEGCTVPALILTARSELSDKLEGFDAGAEDYLTKPFELEELFARVQVLLRGKGRARKAGHTLEMNDIRLNRDTHVLSSTANGTEVRLSQKEFTLLEYFLENQNILLSSEQITERIWGYDTEVIYNNAEVYISFLRKKLRFISVDAEIVTVRGSGYMLRGKTSE